MGSSVSSTGITRDTTVSNTRIIRIRTDSSGTGSSNHGRRRISNRNSGMRTRSSGSQFPHSICKFRYSIIRGIPPNHSMCITLLQNNTPSQPPPLHLHLFQYRIIITAVRCAGTLARITHLLSTAQAARVNHVEILTHPLGVSVSICTLKRNKIRCLCSRIQLLHLRLHHLHHNRNHSQHSNHRGTSTGQTSSPNHLLSRQYTSPPRNHSRSRNGDPLSFHRGISPVCRRTRMFRARGIIMIIRVGDM